MLKAVPQASGELANVVRLASSPLPLVPVLRVVDNFRAVLGTPMALVVMPYHQPLLEWECTASDQDLLRVVASACEVGAEWAQCLF